MEIGQSGKRNHVVEVAPEEGQAGRGAVRARAAGDGAYYPRVGRIFPFVELNIFNIPDLFSPVDPPRGQGNNSERVKDQASDVAMGGGEEEFYEKKMTKEEKKALAKAKREEKKRAKLKAKGLLDEDAGQADDSVAKANKVLAEAMARKREEGEEVAEVNPAAEELASEGTICTYASSRKGVDARSRDVNVQNFTLQHKGTVMLDGTSIVLNHGNRYGLIGR